MIRLPALTILTTSNTKTKKGLGKGYVTAILHLKPSKQLCPKSTPACLELCLNTAGMGQFANVQNARERRSNLFHSDFATFKKFLDHDIALLKAYCAFTGHKLCIRLNGTSDVVWEKKYPEIFYENPSVIFYDYTKIPGRNTLPDNYRLTFSVSENNWEEAVIEFKSGKNLAVVFEKVPSEWKGIRVIPGDEDDLRFLDPQSVVVGLLPKGKAKRDTTGYVVRGL